MIRVFATLLLVFSLSSALAEAQDKPTPGGLGLPPRAETQHAVALGDSRLDYRAIAEALPVRDAKGVETASVFTVTYLVEPPAARQRPVAFLFNGGPGAASVFLHLGAIGPRIMETPETGAVPRPPVRIVDNPATWLPFTDLVFIDPVGTGFSRGEGKEDNPDKPFWQLHADLASLGAVVRLWLTRHQRWTSPVFLVGESYGGFRAAAMARSLARDGGVVPSGLVLISPALDTSVLHHSERDLIAAAVALPSYAAAAANFAGETGQRGGPARDQGAVEQFALSDYLVGLAQLKGQPKPGDPFMSRVAQAIGLPEEIVRRHRGRVPSQIFAREIRRAEGEVVSLYDATVTRPARADEEDEAAGDPVLDNSIEAYTAAFESYAAEELAYRTDLPYRVLPREISRQWDWQNAGSGEGGLGLALSSLEGALLAHPQTKVLIAHGRFDLVTPYLGSRWLIDQLAIPTALRESIGLRVYDGGHMVYTRPQSRAALARDAAALFAPASEPSGAN